LDRPQTTRREQNFLSKGGRGEGGEEKENEEHEEEVSPSCLLSERKKS
jgi:hypothetical protein